MDVTAETSATIAFVYQGIRMSPAREAAPTAQESMLADKPSNIILITFSKIS